MFHRSKRSFIVLLVGLFALFAANAISAELDENGTPTYGTITVSGSTVSGSVSVLSGGPNYVPDYFTSSGCVGYAATAPDLAVSLTYDSFTRLVLNFDSNGDTTMIVHSPDDLWYCDDDSGGNSNPQVVIAAPPMGVYQVWIGSFSSDGEYSGTVTASGLEVRPYAMICITNDTNSTVNYFYRWGNGEWSSTSLEAGYRGWHSWTYDDGNHSSPDFYVRFDEDLNSRESYREYVLERYAASAEECDEGYQYNFDYLSNTRIDLFDQE